MDHPIFRRFSKEARHDRYVLRRRRRHERRGGLSMTEYIKIRDSKLSIDELADKYGIKVHEVCRIRSGEDSSSRGDYRSWRLYHRLDIGDKSVPVMSIRLSAWNDPGISPTIGCYT